MASLKESPTSFSNLSAGGYYAIALGALSTVANQTVVQRLSNGSQRTVTGSEALAWLKNELYDPEVLKNNPKYIFAPRTDTQAPLQLLTTSLPSTRLAKEYAEKLIVAGGKPPYSYSLIAGSLPQGIQLSGSGTLIGTALQTGEFSFTIEVEDADNNTDSISLQLLVGDESSILLMLPKGKVVKE